ncbi:hypothetical protein PHMEG_0003587 [Phytophthora megakarya]|uniref:Uncharacterized protein n=1 Tax=Phytophthora megakarya TaxID=4795 RepID=A0A225WXM9_9STRA|nr:hypothetical protein PHMEG_0003587 [Phytophthora megakarya]
MIINFKPTSNLSPILTDTTSLFLSRQPMRQVKMEWEVDRIALTYPIRTAQVIWEEVNTQFYQGSPEIRILVVFIRFAVFNLEVTFAVLLKFTDFTGYWYTIDIFPISSCFLRRQSTTNNWMTTL